MKLPIKSKVYSMKIDAGHTPMGNPKRGWLLYDAKGFYLGFVDEGYGGYRALTKIAPNVIDLGTIPTSKTFYNDMEKDDLTIVGRKNPSKKSRSKGKSKKRSKSRSKGRSKGRSRKRTGEVYTLSGRYLGSIRKSSAKGYKYHATRADGATGTFKTIKDAERWLRLSSKAKSKTKGRSKGKSRKGKSRKGKNRKGKSRKGKSATKAARTGARKGRSKARSKAKSRNRKGRSKSGSKARSRAKGRSRKSKSRKGRSGVVKGVSRRR